MKKNVFFLAALSLVFSSFYFSGSIARAEDPLLKIQVLPDQSTVKTGMMFLVNAQVINSSADTSVEFWSHSCSYEKHWVADSAEVLIQSWTCNENILEQNTLDPGDIYEKNIILYIPKKDKAGPVSFRLGFKRMSEDGDVAEPLWSDPVTMNVVVPEEMKESTSPVAEKDASPGSDETASIPVEKNKISSRKAPTPEASAESKPLEFKDPGVPLRVQVGDEFSIALASNPSTGFHWRMTLPKGQETVAFLGSSHVVSREVMPGAPGKEVYKFKAATPGETKADFIYERPWEPKAAPTRKIFTILVQKN